MSDNRAATFGSMAREEFSHFLAGASEILGQFGLTKPANTVYLGEDNEVYVRINTRSSTEYGPYYLSDGGTIQFFKHDKPAEFYGKEACLVRNDTVRGLYVIRAPEGTGVNSLYRYKHLFEEREAAVERQKQYESGRPYVHEREVGVNCGHVSPVVVAQDPPQTPIRPLPVPPTAPIAPHGVIFGTPVFLDPIHRGFGTNGSFDEQGHWTPNATSDDPKPIFQIREYPNGRLLTLNSGGWGRGFTSPLVLNGEAGGATADGVITTIGFMGTPRSPFIFGADASRWNEDDDQVSGANPTSTDLPARHLDKRTNTLYKTEMCRNWNEVGDCRYGRSCQFAHGQKELRPVVRHGQWKTKTCMAWLNGGCTYGSRCCYAHEIIPDPDMKVNNQDYDPRDPSGSSGDDLTGFDFQGTLTHT